MSWVSSERICLAVSDTLCIKHNGKSQIGASVDLLKESAQSDRNISVSKLCKEMSMGERKLRDRPFLFW